MEESMDAAQAAARLGVPAAEVASVEATDHGDVVTTADGRAYLLDGQGGLSWWLEGPKASPIPVFVPDVEDAQDVDGDGVPDGSARVILDWVGEDATRAGAALEAEKAKGESARSTLVAALEKLAG